MTWSPASTRRRVTLAAAPVVRFLPALRLGLLRALGPAATVKANLGHYERAASFLKLYGNGDERLLGNPLLVPERGTNADLALWIDHGARSIGVTSRTTLFGALTDDLITWIPNAQGISRAANVSRARVYGVEQELRLALGAHARVVAQGTITVAEDRSDNTATHGRQLPHHPRYLAYVRPEALRLPLGGTWEGEVYADATVLAGDYDNPNNQVAVRSRALVGDGPQRPVAPGAFARDGQRVRPGQRAPAVRFHQLAAAGAELLRYDCF